MDKIIFQNTDDFTALYNDGKYAIYSNKEQKFITDYLFEKISYVPARNYFVVGKDGKNMVIDTRKQNKFSIILSEKFFKGSSYAS